MLARASWGVVIKGSLMAISINRPKSYTVYVAKSPPGRGAGVGIILKLLMKKS
jgi:hypothetical protein|tara:strand:- start:329 stop:487 length:159 start_codon:yes stop_codon:yes gene_type:complete